MAALPWCFAPPNRVKFWTSESPAIWHRADVSVKCVFFSPGPVKSAEEQRDCSVALHRRKAKRQRVGGPGKSSTSPLAVDYGPIQDDGQAVDRLVAPDNGVGIGAAQAGPVASRDAGTATMAAATMLSAREADKGGAMAGVAAKGVAALKAVGAPSRAASPNGTVANGVTAGGANVAGMWLPPPPSVDDVRANYTPATLAFLGDAIWEVFMRRHFFRPRRVGAYHQDVTAHVRAESQAAHVDALLREDNEFLTPEERCLYSVTAGNTIVI